MRKLAFLILLLCSCSSPQPAPASCATDPRVEAFSVGMSGIGAAGATMKIANAVPSLVQQGFNEWTLVVHDASGNAVDGTITVSSTMPDHGHSSPTLPTITPKGNGTYDIAEINLTMVGVWQIAITITSPTINDTVTFIFCVDGST